MLFSHIFTAMLASDFSTTLRFQRRMVMPAAVLLLALGGGSIAAASWRYVKLGHQHLPWDCTLFSQSTPTGTISSEPQNHPGEQLRELGSQEGAARHWASEPGSGVREAVGVVALPLPQPRGFDKWLTGPEPRFSLPRSENTHASFMDACKL